MNLGTDANVSMMPTKEEIEATPGTPLTKEDMRKLKAEGQLPPGMDPEKTTGAVMHKVMCGGQEVIFIMLDPPPCACVKLANGKKRYCKKHRHMRREKKKEKKAAGGGMVKDDGSDRKKVVDLRHAEDSEIDEEKAIDGAITPDKIAVVGPAGCAVLVDIAKPEGPEVGPNQKIDKPMKGILVQGAHDTPQFIPEDKIQKGPDGKPKNRNYTAGYLRPGPHGESIFYADGQIQPDNTNKPADLVVPGVDKNLQNKVGRDINPPVEVDINRNGMPEIRQITENYVVKDRNATVGVISRNRDGVCVLAVSQGQQFGAQYNAPPVPTTPEKNAKPGDIVGKLVEDENGNERVIKPNENPGPNERQCGIIVLGNNKQPVLIRELKEQTTAAIMPTVVRAESVQKGQEPAINRADVLVQSKVEGKTVQQVEKERAQEKAIGPAREVWSTSLCGGPERPSRFVKKSSAAPAPASAAKPPPPPPPRPTGKEQFSVYLVQKT
ncbi:hypothetical protein Q1695_011048 [Nippostrongylus brasiliensis]|nr:hypothetical protein Q1695_011048 [Nippostrongylus brasiliensis]